MIKKKHKLIGSLFVSLINILTIPSVAESQQVRHPISTRQAMGIEGKAAEIKVYPYQSGATVVNFRPTEEAIRQVSLIGTSLFLSSDDPGCLSSESSTGAEACNATILYLQQKPQESIPKALRGVETTRMSVITDDRIYTFQITLASGEPEYSVVEIYPEKESYQSLISIDELTELRKGFQVALQQSYLENPELQRRIRQFLDLARREISLEEAAAKAGISMKVVSKLQDLGSGVSK